jgi:uncharacterized protein YjlB
MKRINSKCLIKQYLIEENDPFPNSVLPVLHYKKAFDLPLFMPGSFIKRLFARHSWKNAWKAGVLEYHHYHSVTHEVLGVFRGRAQIMLGGKNGTKVTLEKGDVLLIPAGVAHKNMGKENDLLCVGAYPDGKDYDMNTGKKGERPRADRNIHKVPLPDKDPVFGTKGGSKIYWS